jgi:hypothetical protein
MGRETAAVGGTPLNMRVGAGFDKDGTDRGSPAPGADCAPDQRSHVRPRRECPEQVAYMLGRSIVFRVARFPVDRLPRAPSCAVASTLSSTSEGRPGRRLNGTVTRICGRRGRDADRSPPWCGRVPAPLGMRRPALYFNLFATFTNAEEASEPERRSASSSSTEITWGPKPAAELVRKAGPMNIALNYRVAAEGINVDAPRTGGPGTRTKALKAFL